MSLVVTEDFLDIERSGQTADDLISEIIRVSERLLRCSNCGRIIILNETKDEYEVRFFAPDNE
jgi:hypothetical protein